MHNYDSNWPFTSSTREFQWLTETSTLGMETKLRNVTGSSCCLENEKFTEISRTKYIARPYDDAAKLI